MLSRCIRVTRPLLWTAVIIAAIVIAPTMAEEIRNGISLCLGTVIPSIFPFMVISCLITAAGVGADIGRLFSPLPRFLFGASKAAACPIFLAFACGFPVGAMTAASMHDKGELSTRELGHLMSFINLPSAPFVIGAVGGMLGSAHLGMAIYTSLFLSSTIIGILSRHNLSKERSSSARCVCTPSMPPFSEALTEALRRAAPAALNVSVSVIIFSSLSGALRSSELFSLLPAWADPIAAGLFEISSGAAVAASLPSSIAPYAAAAVCGWSGLSVHLQIMSAVKGRGISLLPYFISKAVSTILSPVILFLILRLFPV